MIDSINDSGRRPATQAAPSVAMRCLRVVVVVANGWTLLGAALLWAVFVTSPSSPLHGMLHRLSLGVLLIAFAIYSLVMPLFYVVRAHERSAANHV